MRCSLKGANTGWCMRKMLCPQQRDSFNCGVFICMVCDYMEVTVTYSLRFFHIFLTIKCQETDR